MLGRALSVHSRQLPSGGGSIRGCVPRDVPAPGGAIREWKMEWMTYEKQQLMGKGFRHYAGTFLGCHRMFMVLWDDNDRYSRQLSQGHWYPFFLVQVPVFYFR